MITFSIFKKIKLQNQKAMYLQKQILNIYEKESFDKNTFLHITWFGRSFYEGSGDKMITIREVIVTNIKDAIYDVSKWKGSKIFKIEIREEEIVAISLGSIYNSKGKLIVNPMDTKQVSRLYIHKLEIDETLKMNTTGLFNILRQQEYPIYKSEKYVESENIYQGAPYYIIEKKNTDFILPVHVVNRYFFYKNSVCVNNISLNNIIHLFERPYKIDGQIIVSYDGSYIDFENAKFLSKYLFLTNGNNIDSLIRIPSKLQLINRSKMDVKRAYMVGGVPVYQDAKLIVIGQYISQTKNPSEKSKFLVYGIKEYKTDKSMFSLSNYILHNLNDKRSADVERDDNEKGYTHVVDKVINQKAQSNISAINTSIKPKEDQYFGYLFEESPEVVLLDKKVQSEFFKFDNTSAQEVEGYNMNYNETYSKSKKGKYIIETTIENNEFFRLFKETIFQIRNIKNYTAEIIEISTTQIFGYSTSYPTILCGCIGYKEYNYYLLDYGFGETIPMFRRKDGTMTMSKNEIEDIILNVFDLNFKWRNLLKDQNNKNVYHLEGVYIVSLRSHSSSKFNFEKGVESLKSRICESIFTDRTKK